MAIIGIIGGSGVYELPELTNVTPCVTDTPYGRVEHIQEGELDGNTIFFLPRHGVSHHIPPHCVNYRANIDAFDQCGVEKIFALNTVGGISPTTEPGAVVIPDQIIDYTYGREHTFYDGSDDTLAHIEFEYPLSEDLRNALIEASLEVAEEGDFGELSVVQRGVYGCTQGPRLETAAEIRRLQQDGCDVVGMTLMPEAALAREAAIHYASLCIVVNWGAGLGHEPIQINEVMSLIENSAPTLREILRKSPRFL